MSTRISKPREVASMCGYALLVIAIALHFAFWERARFLHGFWGHLNEASRWMQTIDITSLLAIALCLFGIGWKRWTASSIALGSFVLSWMYAAGL